MSPALSPEQIQLRIEEMRELLDLAEKAITNPVSRPQETAFLLLSLGSAAMGAVQSLTLLRLDQLDERDALKDLRLRQSAASLKGAPIPHE